MQQRSAWQRAAAGLAVAALMIGATVLLQYVAIAQVADIQDRLIQISPGEGSEELQVQPFPGEDQLIEAPKHWVGLMAGPVPELLRKHLRLEEGEGVLVLHVVDDSPAAKAGVVKDDILLTAGDKGLAEARDLIEIVRELGDKELELEVIHEGERATVKVTPAERPEKFDVVPLEQDENGNDWQIVPGDMPEVRNWFEQLPQGKGLQFRSLGPGMLFKGGQLKLDGFPSGLSVQVQKQGDSPAKVKVQKGDENWEFEADDQEALEHLPDDVRNAVDGMLGGSRLSFDQLNIPGGFTELEGFKESPFGGQKEMIERMKQLEKQMEEFRERLQERNSDEQ